MLSSSMYFFDPCLFCFGCFYPSSNFSSFMQFSNFGNLEQHGFARNKFWSVDSDSRLPLPSSSKSFVDLILVSSEEDKKMWFHE